MKLFNMIVFLLLISITALVIPSMIPNITVVAVFLLSLALLFNAFFKSHDLKLIDNNYSLNKLNFSNLSIPLLALSMLFFYLFFNSFNTYSNVDANFTLFILHALFLLFIVNTKEHLVHYIRAYILLAVVMATCGVLAQLIVEFGFNPHGSYINLSELTDGAYTRDRDKEFGYVFPYNLGLILTADGSFSYGGFSFYRISGWAHEPTSATLFIAPAILLLIHSNIIRNNLYRYFGLIVLIIFWLFAMAVGSIIAFIILYSLLGLTTLHIKYFPKKLSLLLIVGFITVLPILLFFSDSIFNTEILVSKFSFQSHTMSVAINNLTWFMPDENKPTTYYLSHLFLWINIFIFLYVSLIGIILKKFVDVNSLILFYLILHTMKGSQESVFVLIFIYFWFYVAYFAIEIEKDEF
jgi:hypothetical protein